MRRSTTIGAAATLLASLLPAVEAQAQTPREIRFQVENDFFNPFTEQTDRYYTQGLRYEILTSSQNSDTNFLPGISHTDWCSLVCGDGAREGSASTGYAGGQEIYTPARARVSGPQPYDRPWAGLLYASRIARVSYREPRLRAERQDRIELTLGVVGPASLAREAQTEWHRFIQDDLPRGWDNQLRNEPILQLRYETALRWQTPGRTADITPRVRANLGNALVSLEAEVTARIGWNLPGFGAPAPPMSAPQASGPGWPASGNLFLRAGLKAVAHNIFLDGNSFADNDIRISRTPLVPEVAVGVEANLTGKFWLTLQFVRRGSEFEGRFGRAAAHQDYGAITISVIG